MALPIAAGGLPPTRQARPAPAQHNQASESILELKTGRKRNKGSMRIEHTRNSTVIRHPTKNEPPMRGSLTLPKFILPKTKLPRFGAMILELKTGRKRNKGVEAYWHTRNSTVIRHPTKNEPPMRGSLALPEFVLPKPKLPRFGAMILELKTGRKRNGGLKRIKHTRESPLSVPHKKRTSHERFVSTSGVRSENQGYPIWRNDFGAKNGAQAKQRVEAY